jgi:hypothetical protein
MEVFVCSIDLFFFRENSMGLLQLARHYYEYFFFYIVQELVMIRVLMFGVQF